MFVLKIHKKTAKNVIANACSAKQNLSRQFYIIQSKTLSDSMLCFIDHLPRIWITDLSCYRRQIVFSMFLYMLACTINFGKNYERDWCVNTIIWQRLAQGQHQHRSVCLQRSIIDLQHVGWTVEELKHEKVWMWKCKNIMLIRTFCRTNYDVMNGLGIISLLFWRKMNSQNP